jgi:hypothetical protein
LTC